MMLPGIWADETKCETGIEALRQYVKKKSEGEQGPDGEEMFIDAPVRNWATHPADALRTLAMGLRPERGKVAKLYPEIAIV